jgi:hypothetical protein
MRKDANRLSFVIHVAIENREKVAVRQRHSPTHQILGFGDDSKLLLVLTSFSCEVPFSEIALFSASILESEYLLIPQGK